MTETTVLLTSNQLRGARSAVVFTEQSPTAPFAAERLLVINAVIRRLVVVARNETTKRPELADVSPVITPAVTAVAVQDQFLFTLADWSVSAAGQLRKYMSASLSTPLLKVTDADASGPLAVVGTVLVHGRSRGASLVARNPDTLAVIKTILLPAPPTLILVDGLTMYVFCKNHRAVEVVTWDEQTQSFDLNWPYLVPMAGSAVDAVFDGARIVAVAPEHAVVFDVETEATLLVHHDNNIGFSSVAAAIQGDEITDGVNDPEYIAALWHARFNPGKDRVERDYYVSAEQLSSIASVFGTAQTPTDPKTNQLRQRYVRKVGQRWMALDGVAGKLAMSGDLLWQFRGANVAENPFRYLYNEPDALALSQVSNETAVGARINWHGDVQWKRAADNLRFAYLDGSTYGTFGSLKALFLPGAASFLFWARMLPVDDDTVMTLLSQDLDPGPVVSLKLAQTDGVSSVIYRDDELESPVDLFDDAWHLISIIVRADDTVQLYIDESLVGEFATGGVWTPTVSPSIAAPLYLGKLAGSTTENFTGWLGNLRIYRGEYPSPVETVEPPEDVEEETAEAIVEEYHEGPGPGDAVIPLPDVGDNTNVYVLGGDVAAIDVKLGKFAYIAGSFTSVTDASGTYARGHAACLDVSTGLWTSWDPDVSTGVAAIHVASDGFVYLGFGTGGTVGGVPRAYVARVDPVTAALDAWNPTFDGVVLCFASLENRVFIGGGFVFVNTLDHYGICSFTNGTLDAWVVASADQPLYGSNISGGPTVSSMILLDGEIFIVGALASRHTSPFVYWCAAYARANLVTGTIPQMPDGALGTTGPTYPSCAVQLANGNIAWMPLQAGFFNAYTLPAGSPTIGTTEVPVWSPVSGISVANSVVIPAFASINCVYERFDGTLLLGRETPATLNGDPDHLGLDAITLSGTIVEDFQFASRGDAGFKANPQTRVVRRLLGNYIIAGGSFGGGGVRTYDGKRAQGVLILDQTTGARH